jgi:hypothetical protein
MVKEPNKIPLNTRHVVGDEVDARQDQATANKDDNRGARGEAKDLTAHTMPEPKDDDDSQAGGEIQHIPNRTNHHGEIYSNLPTLFAGGSSTHSNITGEEVETAKEPIQIFQHRHNYSYST